MLLTKNQIELGDFSYFSQIYEAIKLSILEYGQFPWWNPWVAGGVPLYGNPQAGVFSITTILSLVFAPPFALKLTYALFCYIGYSSFYILLRKYSVKKGIAVLVSLIWIFNSYFAAHLPYHFTFLWLMIMPLFIYLALSMRSPKSGGILGIAVSLMVLSQLHYSSIMICILIATVIAARLIKVKDPIIRKEIIISSFFALVTIILLTTHRVIHTIGFSNNLPEKVFDPTSSFLQSVYAFIIQPKMSGGLPQPFYGWTELTAYSGVLTVVALVSIIAITIKSKRWLVYFKDVPMRKYALMGAVASFLIGLGSFSTLAPYSLIKLLPLMSDLRISSRWFIITIFFILFFLALYFANTSRQYKKTPLSGVITTLIFISTIELFILNFNYFAPYIKYPTVKLDNKHTSQLSFQQQIRYGESSLSPDKIPVPFSEKQYLYREYDSTVLNLGTILGNEAHVDIYENRTALCSYVAGCKYIRTTNAKLIKWTPNEVVVQRIKGGDIILNANSSKYAYINSDPVKEKMAYNSKKLLTIPDKYKNTITVSFK